MRESSHVATLRQGPRWACVGGLVASEGRHGSRGCFGADGLPKSLLQGPFERSGWLQKQGELLPNWRRRFFVIKQGKIFWFKKPEQGQAERPRGCIDVRRCLSIKGAEDAINKVCVWVRAGRAWALAGCLGATHCGAAAA